MGETSKEAFALCVMKAIHALDDDTDDDAGLLWW